MPATTDYASGLAAAAIAEISADTVVGIGGSHGVLTVEELPVTDGPIIIRGDEQPYIGVRALSSVGAILGNIESYPVRLVVLCGDCVRDPGTIDGAGASVVFMAQRVCSVLSEWLGQTKAGGCVLRVEPGVSQDVQIDEECTTAHIVLQVLVDVSYYETE